MIFADEKNVIRRTVSSDIYNMNFKNTDKTKFLKLLPRKMQILFRFFILSQLKTYQTDKSKYCSKYPEPDYDFRFSNSEELKCVMYRRSVKYPFF